MRLEEKGEAMSIDEALWELEQLQVGELVAKGSEVGIVRRLTRTVGMVAPVRPRRRLSMCLGDAPE